MSRTAAALILLVALLGAACSTTSSEARETPGTAAEPSPRSEKRPVLPEPADDLPNIVVFMTDDMHLGQMEALARVQEQLFDQGMTFTQSVVNLPSCCPSRATFLTGQHAVNHGVLTNGGISGGFANFTDQDATLPVALSEQGYATAFFGKYLNGYGLREEDRYVPPGWSDFRALVTPTETLYHSPTLFVNGELESYGEDVLAINVLHEETADGVSAAIGTDRPVFAWVSYPAPHAQAGGPFSREGIRSAQRDAATLSDEKFLRPPLAPAEDVGSFGDASIPEEPSFNEPDVEDKPDFLHRRVRPDENMDAVLRFHQATLESLISVDRSIGELISLFEERSDRETWFLFTSDNGLLLGQHRHFGIKYYPYEETVRVPLGVKGPSVDEGTRTPQLVSNIDLAPTILDIAGATEPRRSDGRSLLPVLEGKEAPQGRAVLIQGFQIRPNSPPYKAVHTGDSVYVEWLSGHFELYDLQADPYQLENLYGEPNAAALQTRNEALLRQLEGCTGTACHRVGDELPAPSSPTRSPDQ